MARWVPRVGRVTLFAGVLFAGLPTLAWSQTYQLARVRVVGAQRLPAATVVRMTGLKTATMITTRDVERARGKLLETGLFAEVGYSFRMDGHALTVTFDVREPPWDAKIVFDNFVWFSDEELTATVARVLPGFSGHAPTLPQSLRAVTQALESALRTRAVPGTVSHLLGGGADRAGPTYVFRVDRPEPMPVCRLDFDGVSPQHASDASARVRTAIGQSYSRDFLERLVDASLLTFYGQHGYLKASLRGIHARPTEEEACRGGVSVTVAITEGRQYLWGGATWVGIGDAPAQELDGLLGMSPDAPVDTERLAGALRRVRDRFARQGYFASVVNRTFTFSESDGRAMASVTVTRGPRVVLQSFAIQGLPADVAAPMAAGWTHPLETYYDALYVGEFLKAARAKFPAVFAAYPQTSVTATPTTPGRVAVTITFSR